LTKTFLQEQNQFVKSALQYFFAHNWPMKIYFGTASTFGLFIGVGVCKSNWSELNHWYDIIFVCVLPIIVSPVLFFFLSIFPCGYFVLAPLYYLGAKLNGAPFQIGDRVRILIGPHRNQIVKIYAVWTERNQVRVELGDLPKEKVKDVFSFTQVCRERSV